MWQSVEAIDMTRTVAVADDLLAPLSTGELQELMVHV
jgi:hypothetical protein